MRKLRNFLICLLVIMGITTKVNAASYASTSINVYTDGTKYEYINGVPIYYTTASGYNVYILNSGTYYTSGTVLTDPQVANEGFAYIVNNSNVTNSSYKNYYIASVAILWYQDYLNGNDGNIPSSVKTHIESNTSDTVCYYINKLVSNAKNYTTNGSPINFLDKNITFTRNGNYYYSNIISVETRNLNTTPYVRLYNAPTSADIINNTVTSNGVGSFQIRIPLSSLSSINEKDFEVYITGGSNNNVIYKYSNYGLGEVIYARTYSGNNSNVEASLPVNIKGNGNTTVRLSVLDQYGNYIKGLSYSIYSGDCSNTTCLSTDLVHNFVTTNSYTELRNILSQGTYTLVRQNSVSNYNLPYRTTFYVDGKTVGDIKIEENKNYQNYYNNNNNYSYNNNYNNSNYYNNNNYSYNNNLVTRKVTIYNDINDSRDIISIYSDKDVLYSAYRSDETGYSISLQEGTYYIIDSYNKFNKIIFKIDNRGDLYVYDNNEFKYASAINIDINKSNYNYIINDENAKKYYDDESNTYYFMDDESDTYIDITREIETTTDVKIEWLSNIVDCPITSLQATVKYIIGAMVLCTGIYLLMLNVKKNENNI